MSEPSRRRSALVFALDVTGGAQTVYRVVVFLQSLVTALERAPGLTNRVRIDLALFDARSAEPVERDHLVGRANELATQPWATGARLGPLREQIANLPDEGGGTHVFCLLTRSLATGWEADVEPLRRFVASVTGLCYGPEVDHEIARMLSKSPGGIQVVNPLDIIGAQFQAIAAWLTDNFADRPSVPPPAEPPIPPPPPDPPPPDPPAPPVARWRVLEPANRADAVPHTRAERRDGWAGWSLVGASRRGKLHAHEGTYRDDEFALGAHRGWNLIAVADGAGSVRLSRVGARVATAAAISGLARGIDAHWLGEPPEDVGVALRAIAAAGVRAARDAVFAEARVREITPRDLSSTLLLLAHSPPMNATGGQEHLLATAQVGDGLLAIILPDGATQALGEADKGFYSGETLFLPGLAVERIDAATRDYRLTETPRLLLVMTDGIADDLVPLARQMPTLVGGVVAALDAADPAAALLETICYEKRDSADDRTLVALAPMRKGN